MSRSRVRAAALLLMLLLVGSPSSSMVIRDADSAEVPAEADADVDAAPQAPSEPPAPSSDELLDKISWGCSRVKPIPNITLDTIMGRWYLLEIVSPTSVKRQDACAGVDFWRWDDEENNLMPDVVPPPMVGPEHLVMRGFNKHANDHHHHSSYRVDTAAVVPGSGGALWDQPGEHWRGQKCAGGKPPQGGERLQQFRKVRSVSACTVAMGASVAVLDFTPDARFMTVTTCVRAIGFEWTSVLGRDSDSSALAREELHERLRAAGLHYVDNARLQNNTECVYP